jgi:hypothetical protein
MRIGLVKLSECDPMDTAALQVPVLRTVAIERCRRRADAIGFFQA